MRQTCCNPVHLLPFMHLTTNLSRGWGVPHRGTNYCPNYQGGKEKNIPSRKTLHTPYCQGGPRVFHTVFGCEVFKHLEAGQLYLCIFSKMFYLHQSEMHPPADGLINDTAILKVCTMKITS